MTDHHDFGYDDGGHSFDDGQHDPLPSFEDSPAPDDHLGFDDFGHEDPGHDDHLGYDEPHEVAVAQPEEHQDISDMPELTQPAEDLFPPTVDVGELPEPVDGFPWIDSGSLGLADIQAALHEAGPTDPVHPQDLAEYAATDLPPGEDPWAALADSDDPATAALARWWQQN